MKILFEIGHPAHVHYYRNLIIFLENKGHKIKILAQDRGIISELLEKYNLKYEMFPNLPKNIIGKLLYIPIVDFIIFKMVKRFGPDLQIGFASTFISHVGWLLKIPTIVFDDTEHAKLSHISYKKFANVILTPKCFDKNFGRKHIKFDSYMELSYLHPKYFNVTDKPDIGNNAKKKVLIRFVSWRASHDIGQKGFSSDDKIDIVETLSRDFNVIISSEEELPENLRKYQYQFPCDKIHFLLASVDLYIGEGATMASECAMLGTPAIYVNTLNAGTLMEQEKYGLIYIFKAAEGVAEKAHHILQTPDLRNDFQKRRSEMLAHKIDMTAFMLWFVENYPESFELMKKDPNYQYNFK